MKKIKILYLIFISINSFAQFKTTDLDLSTRYNEVTWPMTHNGNASMKRASLPNEAQVWNQDKSLSEQLANGIRATKIPLHESKGTIKACHGLHKGDVRRSGSKATKKVGEIFGSKAEKFLQEKVVVGISESIDPCFADPAARPLNDILRVVASFLNNNRDEIVTILFEDLTRDHQGIYNALKQAGLVSLAHVQNANKEWPTLKEMLDENKRLVILISSSDKFGKSFPELNKANDFLYSSRYAFKNIEEIKGNDEVRQNNAFVTRKFLPKNKLFQMQHFITPVIGGNPNAAEQANTFNIIKERAANLKKRAGVKPNFIAVDFFDRGNGGLFSAVRDLNKK